MGERLQFRVLGPLSVERSGSTLALRSPTQRALLAALLVHANEPLSHDALAEAVWEGAPPARAEDGLRVHVSQLRKVLGRDAIVTVAGGYMLRLDPDQVDSHRFEEGVHVGERRLLDGEDAAAEEALSAALALCRGAPYDDVRYRDSFQPEIRRLEELRLEALEHRAEAALRLGRHDELIAELTELVEQHPHRERLWARLMLTLYRAGRQADALEAFRRARRSLRDELGLEPGPELRRLERQILTQEPELELHLQEVRLPARVTSFVGRERELAEAGAALERGRLITFVGAGGCGKTRLAIETARRVAAGFPDGVWFVDLATVTERESLAGVVRSALGSSQPTPSPDLEVLLLELERRHSLLVLDNCEHVLDQAAGLASTVLERCPGLRVLATGRERLGVPGEVLYQVPPLTLPDPESDGVADADSVALFLARARELVPGFVLDEQTRPPVVEIVRAVDGIPLAIELAAGRLAAVPLDRLATTVRAAMPGLGTGSRVAVPRHATLRAAFAWSVELLAPAERDLLQRLWIFRGGWTLAALAAVCDESEEVVLAPLTRLVEVSLVDARRRGADVRYLLLEPVRQYARSLVEDERAVDALRAAHRRVYLDVARRAWELFDSGDHRALTTFEADEGNLVAALEDALDGRAAEEAAGLAAALGTYWSHVARYERARHWLGRTLEAAAGGSAEARGDLLAVAGRAETLSGHLGSAEQLLAAAEEIVRAGGDSAREARLLNHLGNARAIRGDMRAAAAAFEASQEAAGRAGLSDLAQRWLVNLSAVCTWMGDTEGGERIALQVAAYETTHELTWGRGLGLVLRGQAALFAGALENAERLLADAVPLVAAHGMHAHHTLGVIWQGLTALAQDRPQRAATFAGEARTLAARRPGWPVRLFAPEILAWSALAEGDLHTVRGHAVTAAQASLETDNLGGMARSLDLTAVLEHRLGAADRAAVLLAAATEARRTLAHARAPHETRATERLDAVLLAELGSRRHAELRSKGAALAPRAAVGIALGIRAGAR